MSTESKPAGPLWSAAAAATFAISSTFTAEPVGESIAFWIRRFHLDAGIAFAAYNQVLQQLLDPSSLLRGNRRGLNCVLIRLDEFSGVQPGDLERNVRDFVDHVRAAAKLSTVPLLILNCPSNRWTGAEADRIEATIAEECRKSGSVTFLTRDDVSRRYPVAEIHDPRGDEMGRIPYTQAYFTAVGTIIARHYVAQIRSPFKVIVTDCDNTLWSGVCGEDGASEIVLDAPRLELQRFLLERQQSGLLLCACSKNVESDVSVVFDTRSDMVLKREHFAAWRVNWQPKSQNILSLAKELNLGLSSFIFLDDNPAECAEVSAGCPEVLTICLSDPSKIGLLMRHHWALDLGTATEEDRQRTAMYRQNRERERFRQEATSYEDFLNSLNLSITLAPVDEVNVARAAQLTQRTNQFNFTTRRRSEPEMQQVLDPQAPLRAMTVLIHDRFGDYGQTGLLLYRQDSSAVVVDTFLLSCRVLGKGVEHAMIRHLGQTAMENGLVEVRIPFIPTTKNAPAKQFLEWIGRDFKQESGDQLEYVFPARVAAQLSFQTQTSIEVPEQASDVTKSTGASIPLETYSWVLEHATDANKILRLIFQDYQPIESAYADYVAPRNDLEQRIAQIWKTLLRRDRISVRDNFFDLGGDSLIAVRLFVALERIVGRTLPLITLFDAPTVEKLAKIVEDADWTSPWHCLVPIKASGSKPPIYCVHGVGGNVIGYQEMVRYLPADQPLYGIQAVGLDGRQPRRNLTVEEMAAIYLEEVRAFQPSGPYFVCGNSFGGLVAYEMARQLTEAGEEVALTGLFDTHGPGYPVPLKGNSRLWRRVNRFRTRVSLHWGNLKVASPDERLKYVRTKLSRLGTTSCRVIRQTTINCKRKIRETIQRMLWPETIRAVNNAGHWAARDYVPKPYKGKVTLFRATEQPKGIRSDPTLGWGTLVGELEIYDTPGHHGAIALEPRVGVLMRLVLDVIKKDSPNQSALKKTA